MSVVSIMSVVSVISGLYMIIQSLSLIDRSNQNISCGDSGDIYVVLCYVCCECYKGPLLT